MGNFYRNWLNMWDEEVEERARARKAIHEEELDWVRTNQDYRAALLCAPENGFATTGNVMLGEIPPGWNTGRHSHGEEALYIVYGKGFSVIGGKRYDWESGSCLFIPFGEVHQHFNAGDETVRYVSAMSVALERFAGLAKFVQYEDASETPMNEPAGIVKAESDIHSDYGRIILRLAEAPVDSDKEFAATRAKAKDKFFQSLAKEMIAPGTPGHRSRYVRFMGWPDTGFRASEVEITGIACDAPGKNSGRHGHMEALLYVLEGEGYSIVDEERIPWKKGTLIHVPGPQTVHQHFNTGTNEEQHLRIHYGMRRFFQPIAKKVFPYRYYAYSAYGE